MNLTEIDITSILTIYNISIYLFIIFIIYLFYRGKTKLEITLLEK